MYDALGFLGSQIASKFSTRKMDTDNVSMVLLGEVGVSGA